MNDALLSSRRVKVTFLGESSLSLLVNWFPSKAEKIVVNCHFSSSKVISHCVIHTLSKGIGFVDMIFLMVEYLFLD